MIETIFIIIAVLIIAEIVAAYFVVKYIREYNESSKWAVQELIDLRARIGAFQFVLRHFMDAEYWPGAEREIQSVDPPMEELQRMYEDDIRSWSEERFRMMMEDDDIPEATKERMKQRRKEGRETC